MTSEPCETNRGIGRAGGDLGDVRDLLDFLDELYQRAEARAEAILIELDKGDSGHAVRRVKKPSAGGDKK